MVEELFLLLPADLLLVARLGHLVAYLFQMVLHQLIVGHLGVVVDLLPEADNLGQRVLALEVPFVADVARPLENPISGLRVRIRHVERLT